MVCPLSLESVDYFNSSYWVEAAIKPEGYTVQHTEREWAVSTTYSSVVTFFMLYNILIDHIDYLFIDQQEHNRTYISKGSNKTSKEYNATLHY